MKLKNILDTNNLYIEVYVYKFLGVYLVYFGRYKGSNRRHDLMDTRYKHNDEAQLGKKVSIIEPHIENHYAYKKTCICLAALFSIS